jgi:hypothetical protein
MKTQLRLAASLILLAGLAGCDSIGKGSTIQKLEILISPVENYEQGTYLDFGTIDERYHMYDCFCSNIAVVATFTDGTVSNFSNRALFTSDNPAVATVLNLGDATTDRCPLGQQGSGLVIPQGIGTATITASFAGLSDTFKVEVADASINADGSPVSYVLQAASPADPAADDVAVGASLPLEVSATLDGRPRFLNRNVLEWSFDAADDAVATIDAIGVVRGIAPTGALPKTARATFGSCPDLSPTLAINVGDVLGPLTLERETPDFAPDGKLAVASDEYLTVSAALDFNADNVADGSQLVSTASALRFTDSCTLREYDASVPDTFCRETAATCTNATPQCSTSTTCAATMTPCRTEAPSISALSANRILATSDKGTATQFSAVFPGTLGVATTLTADVPDGATELTVASVTGYPAAFPWYGVIDAAGSREDVRVTSASGTTLTVVRGISGTTPVAHASGASFEERSYTSDANAPLPITAKEGTLTTVAVDAPGTLQAFGTLQLEARGTFVDMASLAREQRVNRLLAFGAGTPSVIWRSSDRAVAVVGSSDGLVTSTGACGGVVSIRARATTSTDTTTETFDPDTTADDDACENTDPLCDQVEVCIATPSPLPLGATCDAITTCP